MQPNIYKIVFHSLLFAIGIGPTIAIWWFLINGIDFELNIFAGLTLASAMIAIPIILIQNGFLLYKRKDEKFADQLGWLVKVYFIANTICLLTWLFHAFKDML